MSDRLSQRLRDLVDELDRHDGTIDEASAKRILSGAGLDFSDVAPFVEQKAESYSRRCVVRRESYELLVLTWAPGQRSAAHDHSGCLCGLKVAQGRLTEQVFEKGPDGQVRATTAQVAGSGDILVDPGVIVHALRNDSDTVLVTLHLYSPPLPEARRYSVAEDAPADLFTRTPAKNARTITLMGGGFTGTMTLANLLEAATKADLPLHVVMIDRQAAFGEGVAYRTNDSQHLLNVPAGRMSAWPDRPDDFLAYARSRDASIKPGDFCPRKIYGLYIRETLLRLARASGRHLSVEIIIDEATKLEPKPDGTWTIATASGRVLSSDLAVITLGHRPPNEPLVKRWSGPRHRLICDPWAPLILSQIGPDEPVLLLGTGLTAIDAVLTLDFPGRTAPVIAVSRRGLVPLPHATEPRAAADVAELINRWLDPAVALTARALVSNLRERVKDAEKCGIDWRQVIDGLRPVISKLWQRLAPSERRRFLARLRTYWEVHRHRMAPAISSRIEGLRRKGTLSILSGSLHSAAAHGDGVDVVVSLPASPEKKTFRVSWLLNCTGPGAHNRHTTHPILRPMIEAGTLCEDELHLGLLTDSAGRALNCAGNPQPTLLVAGTLRKSTLWESTAVPELREQARAAAQTAIETLFRNREN